MDFDYDAYLSFENSMARAFSGHIVKCTRPLCCALSGKIILSVLWNYLCVFLRTNFCRHIWGVGLESDFIWFHFIATNMADKRKTRSSNDSTLEESVLYLDEDSEGPPGLEDDSSGNFYLLKSHVLACSIHRPLVIWTYSDQQITSLGRPYRSSARLILSLIDCN